jgi:hypothetical protein
VFRIAASPLLFNGIFMLQILSNRIIDVRFEVSTAVTMMIIIRVIDVIELQMGARGSIVG